MTDKDGNKSKEFRPLTYRENIKTKQRKWGFYGWESPRPLYGLDALERHKDAHVLICEGEKSVDAARAALLQDGWSDDWVVIASPNGAGSVNKCDWSELYGRAITIWPDHDDGGLNYVRAIVNNFIKHDPKCEIWVVNVPDEKPAKWDAADAVDDGMSGTEMIDFVSNSIGCVEFLSDHGWSETKSNHGDATGGEGAVKDSKTSGGARVNKTGLLIEMAACCEFWHDEDDVTYASAPMRKNGHHFVEHMQINERKFKRWLAGQYYFDTGGKTVAEKNIGEACLVLSAKALYEGALYPTYSRVFQHSDEIWVDLVNETRDTVHIHKGGWRVVSSADCPVKFLRPKLLRSLPVPSNGSVLDVYLREFINTDCEEDYMLIVAWLIGCFHTEGPMPLLSLTGTTGSGKSGLHKMLINIIDPQKAAGRRLPEDVRVLSIVADKTHLMMFDNIKSIPAWLSDDLSSLTTGGGFVTRRLTTDDEIMALEMRRPIIMNGIGGIGGQADLISRGIAVEIPKLKRRKTEKRLRHDFEQKLPDILGSLYSALATGLKNYDDNEDDDDPEIRMFDFYKFVVACESGLGWKGGQFLNAYKGNIQKSFHRVVDVEPVAAAIVKHIDRKFVGTASALLDKLNEVLSESKKRNRGWPKTSAAMGTAVKRVESALAQGGYEITRGTGRKAREITIIPPNSFGYYGSENDVL